ncbi:MULTISPECIES: MerC domain-containing protein [Hyphomonas]|nr:MerC domain-containing protein [Hyphomonas atlantica]
MKIQKTDTMAVGLSGLCLVHCLALPVLGSVMPLMTTVAEAEWVHKALVMIALPIALLAFTQTRRPTTRLVFGALATFGGALLVAGAFVESLHDYETHLTVIGACCLAGAHLFRWNRHQQH